MLGQDIRENIPIKYQPTVIKVINSLSFLTLKQNKVQQIGCGHYLFYLPLIGQFGLSVLTGRYFYLLGTQLYHVNNRTIVYWSCISVVNKMYSHRTNC